MPYAVEMSSIPTLSVVMPAHNVAPYVGAAIQSILHQTFQDFEFIIRDDGSTDETPALLREWALRDDRIRLFEGEQLGLAGSSNWVVRQARAPILARMDADDIAQPERLERELNVLRNDPSVLLVGTLADTIDHRGCKIREIDLWRVVRRSRFAPFPHTSVMFRRDAFDAIGGYRPLGYCEDLDFFLRLSNRGRVVVIADALVSHRVVTTSSSAAAEYHERIVTALDQMFAALPPAGSGRSYRPVACLAPNQTSGRSRVSPLAIVSSWSATLWSGGSPRPLGELLRRGRLRLNTDSILALGWASVAQLSPAGLRAFLRGLSFARNFVARRRVKSGQVYPWTPGRAMPPAVGPLSELDVEAPCGTIISTSRRGESAHNNAGSAGWIQSRARYG